MSEHDCCPSCRKGGPCESECSRSLVGQISAMLPGCTDTPGIEAWHQANRAPLYPNQWNAWVVYRTLNDNPSVADIVDSASAVFAQWFKGWKDGSTDHLEVVPLFDTQSPADADGNFYSPAIEQAELAKTPQLVARRSDLPVPPLLTPGKWAKVLVRFVYRGAKTTIPWPVHKASAIPFIFDPWCPSDADWMAAGIYAPDTSKPVPQEPTMGDKVSEALAPITGPLEKIGLVIGGLAILVIIATRR